MQQLLYFFGHGICHQMPSRSFEAGGLYFPICARDTGIYLGIVLSIVIAQLLRSVLHATGQPSDKATQRTEFLPTWAIIVCGLLFLPYFLDGISSYSGLRTTTNAIRYFTGLLAGIGAGALLTPAVTHMLEQMRSSEAVRACPPKLGDASIFALQIALPLATGLLFYLAIPLFGAGEPIVMTLVIWFAMAAVVAIICAYASAFRVMTTTARKIVWVVASLVFALVVLALLGAMRDGIIALTGFDPTLQNLVNALSKQVFGTQ